MCRDSNTKESEKPVDKEKLRNRYKQGLSAYKNCFGSLNGKIQTLNGKNCQETLERLSTMERPNTNADFTPILRRVQYLDYMDSKLSKVEKLFQLTQKPLRRLEK